MPLLLDLRHHFEKRILVGNAVRVEIHPVGKPPQTPSRGMSALFRFSRQFTSDLPLVVQREAFNQLNYLPGGRAHEETLPFPSDCRKKPGQKQVGDSSVRPRDNDHDESPGLARRSIGAGTSPPQPGRGARTLSYGGEAVAPFLCYLGR